MHERIEGLKERLAMALAATYAKINKAELSGVAEEIDVQFDFLQRKINDEIDSISDDVDALRSEIRLILARVQWHYVVLVAAVMFIAGLSAGVYLGLTGALS